MHYECQLSINLPVNPSHKYKNKAHVIGFKLHSQLHLLENTGVVDSIAMVVVLIVMIRWSRCLKDINPKFQTISNKIKYTTWAQ